MKARKVAVECTPVQGVEPAHHHGALRMYARVTINDPAAPDGLRSRNVNVSTDWGMTTETASQRVRELRNANPDLAIVGRLTIDYF